ncbi:MAG: VTT domain-containing protein [Magnetococcales bacterium]|nr:VTT domain-containing protein [Magnetococcales bacterium]
MIGPPSPLRNFAQDFLRRIRERLLTVAGILAGAVILSLALGAAAWLINLLFPDSPLAFFARLDALSYEQAKETVKDLFLSKGAWSELFFVGVQVVQVLFAPIPGQLFGLLGGVVYGFWKGLLLTMTGLALGSWLAMAGGRFFGRWLMHRVVSNDLRSKFQTLANRGSLFDFFIIYLLPMLPDDAVSFMAGLSRHSLSRLMAVCLLGRLPGMAVLTFTGTALDADLAFAKGVFIAAMILSFLLWIYSDKFESLGGLAAQSKEKPRDS